MASNRRNDIRAVGEVIPPELRALQHKQAQVWEPGSPELDREGQAAGSPEPLTGSAPYPRPDTARPATQLTWREYAEIAGIYLELSQRLSGAAVELMDYLHRSICEGQGKCKFDPRAGKRRGIPLIPERLAKPRSSSPNSSKRFSVRTYKAAIARLYQAGVIVESGKEHRRRLLVPCWWVAMFSDPAAELKRANEELRLIDEATSQAKRERKRSQPGAAQPSAARGALNPSGAHDQSLSPPPSGTPSGPELHEEGDDDLPF